MRGSGGTSGKSACVLYEAEAGVATVTLNRPDRLNAMNEELLEATLGTLERAASDETVRAVILTGSGRGFSAGGDLSAGPGGGIGGDARRETRIGILRRFVRTSQLLHDMPKVTIAAVNGPCAGAGLSWACACDLRYGATSAVFKTAFLSAGLSGDFGGTWTLSRIIGPAKARELYLLSDRVSAEAAYGLGLISGLYADDQLMPMVRGVAAKIVSSAPLAMRAIKENLNDAEVLSFADVLDNEVRRHVGCIESEDGAEAATAFVEKRTPIFVGR
jgi:2-(1,2-epoxy-1,2-dihydrophenyl)acetyl-CoA isomerase